MNLLSLIFNVAEVNFVFMGLSVAAVFGCLVISGAFVMQHAGSLVLQVSI